MTYPGSASTSVLALLMRILTLPISGSLVPHPQDMKYRAGHTYVDPLLEKQKAEADQKILSIVSRT